MGSRDFVLRQDSMFNARKHLCGYLRYALSFDESIRAVVVKRGEGDYDIDSRIISRIEVASAWGDLPEEYRWLIWDRIVRDRPLHEVCLAHKVHPTTLQRKIKLALDLILERIYYGALDLVDECDKERAKYYRK